MLRLSKRHRVLLFVLVTSTLLGALAAKANTSGNLQVAAATTHVMVDLPDVPLVERHALTQDVTALQKRAELYARLMTSPPVIETIARRAGLPPDDISAVARTTADVPIPLVEPGSEERASQILDSRAPYRLELQSSPSEPILTVYALAPSSEGALRLADSAVTGARDYLQTLAARQGLDERRLPQVVQLGAARGGLTNGRAPTLIAGITFATAFALSFVLLLFAAYRLGWWAPEPRRARRRAPTSPQSLADWPRTTRVMPWAVAALITMIWLTPFDHIQLAMATPIDLTLDRIVLPVIAAIWLVALTAGPGVAPRLRITVVHVALGVFLACALVSVVLDARYLNQTGELMLAVKKLPLLVSYMSVFVIVASSVRRSEVPAYLKYTLVLSVVVAVGIVIEYRFRMNVFTTLTQRLLPPLFEYTADTTGDGIDSLGRRWVAGPTAYGVEAVGMMAMALPIGILGVISSAGRGRQLLYGLAIAALIAGMFATQRKSALIVPVTVVATLAYFRRRELLSLAPLGLLIGVAAAAASPGAVLSVVGQFTRADAAQVATTSDRTADYDAVRPDLWTHLLFGRGYGTYNHESYRILDSEILNRVIEGGVLGLAAFLFIGISVLVISRRTIAERDPRWAPASLCGTAAAVAFITVSTLFDVTSVPHGTDTFLYMAGLAAVVSTSVETEPRPAHATGSRPRRRPHHRRASPGHVPERAHAGPAAEARTSTAR